MKKISLVAAMMALVFAFVIANPVNEASAMSFTDISSKNAELYKAVTELEKQGIVFGISSKKFGPNVVATRGETAQVIVNALGLQNETVPNPKFSDVPTSHKYYKAIAILAHKNIVKGTGNGKFSPDKSLKRSQIAKILTLSFELESASTANFPFKDVKVAETKGYVASLIAAGVTTGTTKTTFSPNKDMTRSQLTLFVYRALETADSDEFELISID